MNDGANRLTCNPERLWDTLTVSGEIGKGRPGGLARVALSEADREMRDRFAAWCADAGCRVAVDGVGNLFARREGAQDGLPPVLIGSHLDTQVNGGKYDGVLGVLAGLEVIRTLNDRGMETRRPIEVVSWTNEEGARFNPPMVASGAFAGVYDPQWVLDIRDDEGMRLGDELERIGYAGDVPVGGREIDAYFELHIEQGPVLEQRGIDVGVVTSSYSVRGFNIEIRGETAHTGPTPMDQRRNALVGAAEIVVAVNDIGWEHHAEEGKATAARLVAWPNKAGIISDHAEVTVDFRHADPDAVETMAAKMRAAMERAAAKCRVDVEVVKTWRYGNERFSPELIALLHEAAAGLGVPCLDMMSQAGHDAYNISRIAPTAIVFSPCRGGVTHNNHEHIELGYTTPSVDVLLNAVAARANR